MELYTEVAYKNSRQLTLAYSSSFGLSSRLLDASIRHHIYAIYALVRIADEIVDTYRGAQSKQLLDSLEEDVYIAINNNYSTNPIIHAFAMTATQCTIDKSLIKPFFESMHMDLVPFHSTQKTYTEYVYGSAEVVGLMCLRVFCGDDDRTYTQLAPGAQKLGAAYQKVNFLRDIYTDYQERGRMYFPGCTYETMTNDTKATIISDIRADFMVAQQAIQSLPKNSKRAVNTSYIYYTKLLTMLENADIDEIKTRRVRIKNHKKVWLLMTEYIKPRTYRGA